MIKTTKIKYKRHTKKVRAQKIPAKRGGISALGSKYLRGEIILHLSSNRNTGEVFTLTLEDLLKVLTTKAHRKLKTLPADRLPPIG